MKSWLTRTGLLAVLSALWFVLRTGTKPSRITYPCQKAAAANVQFFFLAFLAPLINLRAFEAKLFYVFNRRHAATIVLLSSFLLAFGSVPLTGIYVSSTSTYLHVSLELQPQKASSEDNSSDLFFIENASSAEGNMDEAFSALFQLMENHGWPFFKTASQPAGLIGKDDVLIIKVNCQWSHRGGTNTDLVKSLIGKIVNHPEGFAGEIVVADNGQGRGSLDWSLSNAFNHSQSIQDVVNTFPSHNVSTWLWDTIRTIAVNDYDQGDFDDGYVVNSTSNPSTGLRVTYPKFKTEYGTYISFKKGIWEESSYNSEKLKIINVPVLKSHGVYGVTASVKHYMGVVSEPLAGAHSRVATGGMGTEMVETRVPILNILDCVWVNANPMRGPATDYQDASFTNVIGASQDPVALEYWASKHILLPSAAQRGYTEYSSLDPDYEPRTPGLYESYHNYLERSMNELKSAGYQVAMNESQMNVYVSSLAHDNTLLPTIWILSPENKTYATSSVSLSFTVDEPTSWVAYRLDNKENTTLEGNTTLSGLSDGLHSLIVYAKDTAGNIGASQIVYFSVNTQQFPIFWIPLVAAVIVVIGGAAGFVLYKKRNPV